jgi:putative spermidine/putrescine transport system substrate-binding protein
MLARSHLAIMALLAASLRAAPLLAAPLLGTPGTAGLAQASQTGLTIVTREESSQRAIQAAYVQPFTAVTEIPVQQQVWDGGIDALRAQAKNPDSDWALVLLDPDELATGCAEGLLEKLDWAAIGGRDHYAQQAVSDCGVGALIANTVLAWDREKFPVTPTWADFWDVAKYPGKRGLRKGVRGNLEIALLADGVAAGDVYKTLASTDGLDRAFRKLDQLRPYIVWWGTETESAHILASGDVLMTSAPSGQIARLGITGKHNFGVQFAGSLFEVQSWAVMKGSPSLRTAQQFLYFTGLPAIELRLMQTWGDLGLTRGINEYLPPDLLTVSPSNSANLAMGLRSDTGFWHDNLPKLRQRFDGWLEH